MEVETREEDAFEGAVGAGCWDEGHKARCVTRNPPVTSVTDSHTQTLRIPIDLFPLSRDWNNLLFYQTEINNFNYCEVTYGSSGVKCTGSSVNSGGKFARSLSESRRGLYGGGTCFCSSYYIQIKKI